MLSTQLRDVVLVEPGHDWDLTSGTFKYTSGIDGVAQAINFAVRMHKGEWFMDLDEGIAYFEREGVPASTAILGQRNVEARAIAAYAEVILKVEGVLSIVSISAKFVSPRTLSVEWTCRVTFDDIASATLDGTTLIQR